MEYRVRIKEVGISYYMERHRKYKIMGKLYKC